MAQFTPFDHTHPVLSSHDAAGLVIGFLAGQQNEHLLALYLDDSGRTLGLVEFGSGLKGGVNGELRSLVGPALTHDARAILLAHNHPSGDSRPSAIDLATTRQLALVLKALSIRLHDHLIIAGTEWRSMRADGLL